MKIEILYDTIDQIAQSILKNQNRIPLTEEEIDPNTNRPVSWPESWLTYKEQVKERELAFDREPLTDLQWRVAELYLETQYGLKL